MATAKKLIEYCLRDQKFMYLSPKMFMRTMFPPETVQNKDEKGNYKFKAGLQKMSNDFILPGNTLPVHVMLDRDGVENYSGMSEGIYVIKPYYYKGNKAIKENQMLCAGVGVDFDDVNVNTLLQLISFINDKKFPNPTFIIPSGTGLTLFYRFKENVNLTYGRKTKEDILENICKQMYRKINTLFNKDINILGRNQGFKVPGGHYKKKHNLDDNKLEVFSYKLDNKGLNLCDPDELCKFCGINVSNGFLTRPYEEYVELRKKRGTSEHKKNTYDWYKENGYPTQFFNAYMKKYVRYPKERINNGRFFVRLMLKYECPSMAPYVYNLVQSFGKENYNQNITKDRVEEVFEYSKNIEESPEGKRYKGITSLSLLAQKSGITRDETIKMLDDLLNTWDSKFSFDSPFTLKEAIDAYDIARHNNPLGTWKKFTSLLPNFLKDENGEFPAEMIEKYTASEVMQKKHRDKQRAEFRAILEADNYVFIPEHYRWLRTAQENYNIEKQEQICKVEKIADNNRKATKSELIEIIKENCPELTLDDIEFLIREKIRIKNHRTVHLDFNTYEIKAKVIKRTILNHNIESKEELFSTLHLDNGEDNSRIFNQIVNNLSKIYDYMPETVNEAIKLIEKVDENVDITNWETREKLTKNELQCLALVFATKVNIVLLKSLNREELEILFKEFINNKYKTSEQWELFRRLSMYAWHDKNGKFQNISVYDYYNSRKEINNTVGKQLSKHTSLITSKRDLNKKISKLNQVIQESKSKKDYNSTYTIIKFKLKLHIYGKNGKKPLILYQGNRGLFEFTNWLGTKVDNKATCDSS